MTSWARYVISRQTRSSEKKCIIFLKKECSYLVIMLKCSNVAIIIHGMKKNPSTEVEFLNLLYINSCIYEL